MLDCMVGKVIEHSSCTLLCLAARWETNAPAVVMVMVVVVTGERTVSYGVLCDHQLVGSVLFHCCWGITFYLSTCFRLCCLQDWEGHKCMTFGVWDLVFAIKRMLRDFEQK